MAKFPPKTKDGKPLVSEHEVLDFCASLNETELLTLAMCIDEEVTGLGYGGTRAGSEVWEHARRCAVTEILSRELNLAAMADEHLENLGQTDSSDETVKAVFKAQKKRVEAFAKHLEEESKERQAAFAA